MRKVKNRWKRTNGVVCPVGRLAEGSFEAGGALFVGFGLGGGGAFVADEAGGDERGDDDEEAEPEGILERVHVSVCDDQMGDVLDGGSVGVW